MTLKALRAWATQPSTLLAIGLLVGASVYWFTGSATAALTVASIIPGAVNDKTSALLAKIEALEDAVKSAKGLK